MMDTAAAQSLSFPSIAVTLLSYFSLEPDQYPQPLTKARLLNRWLQTYPQEWVRCALVESLYQGRYKTYCVEQILALWHRRGQPIYHFNHEFETMICNNVPQRKENLLVADAPLVDRVGAHALQPDCGEGLKPSVVLPLPEEGTETSEVSTGLPDEGHSLAPKPADLESDDHRWADAFEWPVADVRESVLASVLNRNQLLPLLLDRIGLVPIHRFIPEAEPVEFCERLAEIARSSRAVTHPGSAQAQR
jgi:hypothetical protein